VSLATSSALVIALRLVRPRERAPAPAGSDGPSTRSAEGEVVEAEVGAAVGAGVAGLAVDLLVVFRAVAGAFFDADFRGFGANVEATLRSEPPACPLTGHPGAGST
jgi:hypothetical protein